MCATERIKFHACLWLALTQALQSVNLTGSFYWQILGPDGGWQPIPLTDIITRSAVKKAYRKATLFVHPDKLQQRGASIQQKYTCEKVFDLLKVRF